MRPGNRTRPVARAFGSWKKKTDVEEDEDDDDEAKINFKGLKQLISMGLGTMSGDITEINLCVARARARAIDVIARECVTEIFGWRS